MFLTMQKINTNNKTTKVVNVKVKHIRPKYNNLKEWMNDDNNVYIGRSGVVFIDKKRYPKNNSIFCNPFKIDSNNSREEVIKKYQDYIIKKIESDPSLIHILALYKGKTLGCWCKPEQCHGDILVELIEKYTA